MTSLRDQVYGVAAADTGAGGVVALLPDGLAALFGSEAQPKPTDVPGGLHLYLQFDAEFPWQPVGAPVQGIWRWRAYDWPHAGYTRINALLARLASLYGPQEQVTPLFTDAATGESLYWVRFGGMLGETADEGRKLLQRWAEWAYRKTYRRAA